jgi:NAD(P)-dependent dehydrogenase (short-subunit alcohol dehydrogenase family)
MTSSSSPVAIVTGGNSGMGMGIVRRLIEKGWKVAIADINENKKFAEELGDASSYHRCNVADYDRLVRMSNGGYMILTHA